MPDNTEPKTVDSIIDEATKAFASQDTTADGQAQVSSPENDQTAGNTDSLPDKPKTDGPDSSNADAFKGADKGFASHPAWQEREAKLKQISAENAEFKRKLSELTNLLNDPDKLRQKIGVGQNRSTLLDKLIEKKGWDRSRITPEQSQQLQELLDMAEFVAEQKLETAYGERIKPLEDTYRQVEGRERAMKDVEDMSGYVSKYGLDWKKDFEPLLEKHLNELDEKDPNAEIKFNLKEWAKDTLIELVSERSKVQGRQEVRDQKKAPLKVVTPGSATARHDGVKMPLPSKDPKGFDAWLDTSMKELGIRG